MSKFAFEEVVQQLRDALDAGRHTSLSVSSNSMAPLFRRDDDIYLESASPWSLMPGDIITVALTDHLLTHRLWRIDEADGHATYFMRGHKPLRFDEPVPTDRLVGRVVGRSHNGRYLSLTTGPGLQLNRHLAWLASQENMRLLSDSEAVQKGPKRKLTTVVHVLLLAWATAVTTFLARLHKDPLPLKTDANEG